MDRTARRAAALNAAASLPWTRLGPRTAATVIEIATIFDNWLAVQPPLADFAITADQPIPRGATTMSLTFTDADEVTLHISSPVDAEGAAVTDTFTWSVDNGNVLTLTPSADTMSCLAVPGTAAGAAVVTATASDGVARTFAIDIAAGPVANFSITADTPVARPAATPAAAPAAGV